MNSLFKKSKFFGMIITGCLMLLSVMPVMAAGNTVETDVKDTAEADVTTSELTVDKETGGFSFQINIVSQKAYAGAEFGVICSEGTEITSVESMAGSMTGPKESNGLVWFGFYEGEDSFSGETTITVKGNFKAGTESAIVIQDIKIYTVVEQEYSTTSIDGGMIINLNSDSIRKSINSDADKYGISVIVPIICCVVIAMGMVTALIYRKKTRGVKE